MSDIAIRAENLSKQYTIGHANSRHDTIGEVVAAFGNRLSAKLRRLIPDTRHLTPVPGTRHLTPGLPSTETFLALNDVSFDVRRGEVMGIIGRNGAGKSTLLKILSRITEPTSGRAELNGRVGSLLEVGTGFHGDLTGRENIFLSGAILGMRREEIRRKFDDIVAFAEVERFIDTPVKFYSSGMYVRLAFAVAAHLEPEILIVDEVLAVGDIEFQKKCLGKMGDVAKQARTVVFVSHNMGAISKLCSRAIWLERGQVVAEGMTPEVVARYQAQFFMGKNVWQRPHDNLARGPVAFLKVAMTNQTGQAAELFSGNEEIVVEVEYEVREPVSTHIGIGINTSEGVLLFYSTDCDQAEVRCRARPVGVHQATCTIPGGLMAPGSYSVFISAQWPHRQVYETLESTVTFEVSKDGTLAAIEGRGGLIMPKLRWETSTEASLKSL